VNIVFVSNLFPNLFDSRRGIFAYNQLVAMRKIGYDFKIVAPVAKFPLRKSAWAEAAGDIPPRETYADFDVYHPTNWYVPLSKGSINAHAYRWSIQRLVNRLCDEHRASLLWGSFAFPDGVAVADIARRRGLPFAVSLLGSDINLNIKHGGRRRAIARSLKQASLVLSKSLAMKDIVTNLGVSGERVLLDYNGVDQNTFAPRPRESACEQCGLDPRRAHVLFVGNFVEVKNLPTLVRAFRQVRDHYGDGKDVDLVLVGDGALHEELTALVGSLGLSGHVHMPGAVKQQQVAPWINACNVLCLPSWAEGVPNVVLEGLASGVPVVASNVGGIPEVHPGHEAGALIDPSDADDLAAGLIRTLDRRWDPGALAGHVAEFTWEKNAQNVASAMERLVVSRSRTTHANAGKMGS
jgi:glycosyltransferase involved in cell wall biosynthesis